MRTMTSDHARSRLVVLVVWFFVLYPLVVAADLLRWPEWVGAGASVAGLCMLLGAKVVLDAAERRTRRAPRPARRPRERS